MVVVLLVPFAEGFLRLLQTPEDLIAAGRIGDITAWLGEKIHRHGSLYKPMELFTAVCGQFDARYFTDYLTEKYTDLYDLA